MLLEKNAWLQDNNLRLHHRRGRCSRELPIPCKLLPVDIVLLLVLVLRMILIVVLVPHWLLIGVFEVSNPAHHVNQIACLALLREPASFVINIVSVRQRFSSNHVWLQSSRNLVWLLFCHLNPLQADPWLCLWLQRAAHWSKSPRDQLWQIDKSKRLKGRFGAVCLLVSPYFRYVFESCISGREGKSQR